MAYDEVMNSKYGWPASLKHMGLLEGVAYLAWPRPPYKKSIELLRMFIYMKAKLGNANSLNVKCTQLKDGPLKPSMMGSVWASLKFYKIKHLEHPEIKDIIQDPFILHMYHALVVETTLDYQINNKSKETQPLFYQDIKALMNLTAVPNFIRKFNEKMGIWYRAWLGRKSLSLNLSICDLE